MAAFALKKQLETIKTTRIMRDFVLLTLSVLLLAACQPQSSKEADPAMEAAEREQERTAAQAAVEAANRAITSLSREGRFEEAGAYFAPDVVQFISGQPPISGREAWIEAQRQAAEIGDWNLELEVLNFEYFGDHAVERGRGVQTFVANESSPIPSMQLVGNYMVLWKKSDNGWQIQYDYVVVEPPAGQE